MTNYAQFAEFFPGTFVSFIVIVMSLLWSFEQNALLWEQTWVSQIYTYFRSMHVLQLEKAIFWQLLLEVWEGSGKFSSAAIAYRPSTIWQCKHFSDDMRYLYYLLHQDVVYSSEAYKA